VRRSFRASAAGNIVPLLSTAALLLSIDGLVAVSTLMRRKGNLVNKSVTRIAVAASLAAALLMPATGAFASDHGGASERGNHGAVRHHRGDHRRPGMEGVIVSIAPDQSSLVVRPPDTASISATILISSSTIITVDAGVTTTTLAVGEQVHILAHRDGDALVAIRIDIQRLTFDGCPGGPVRGSGDDRGASSQGEGQSDHARGADGQRPGCGHGQGGRGNGSSGNGGQGGDRIAV
jgi:hypothetical protein